MSSSNVFWKFLRGLFEEGPRGINERVSVYTAILGSRDQYKEPPKGDYDCTAFLDSPAQATHAKIVVVPILFNDPRRSCRYFKLLPQIFFKDYAYTIWMDGSMSLKSPVRMSKIIATLGDADIAVFRHRERKCVYEEAEACLHYKLDHPGLIKRQMEHYRAEGYPEQNGLTESGIVLRRMTNEVIQFNLAWWNELMSYSQRDQLSFNYTVWKSGLKVTYLEGSVADNPYFELGRHA